MTSFDSIRSTVLALPQRDRFRLMFDIQESLPPEPLQYDDDGVEEAMRRLEEGDRDPSVWLDEEDFHAAVRAARNK